MPLEQLHEYKIPSHIKEIKNEEEKVIALLRNIKDCASCLNLNMTFANLQDVLDMVEIGEWSFQNPNIPNRNILDRRIEKSTALNYNINLSEAKKIIDDYIAHSKKGCEYCGNLGVMYKDVEPGRYCKIEETEKLIVDFPIMNNVSPKIHQFWETGCKDRTPTLKPLEEVLKEREKD